MSKVFNLSVVNVIPDAYRESVNQVAELYDCGDNNLSVKLQDSEGSIYWGCHSWWKPEDYAVFSDDELRQQVLPTELRSSLEFLYERIVLGGAAEDNWQQALVEMGLSLVEHTMD